jgi:hypothetical protein
VSCKWHPRDHSCREVGTGRVGSGKSRSEDLGVCRRHNGRFHPGAGYPASLRRVIGYKAPLAMAGLRRGVSERSACSIGVNAVVTYREPQEQAAGMVAVQEDQSPQRPANEIIDKHD